MQNSDRLYQGGLDLDDLDIVEVIMEIEKEFGKFLLWFTPLVNVTALCCIYITSTAHLQVYESDN